MPNSPPSGFILGDQRAAGRDYQIYTGEVYKIRYRPWKSDGPDKLALGPRGWVSLGCLIPRLSQGWAVIKSGEQGLWKRGTGYERGMMEPNADILSRRGFSSHAARFLRGRHVFGLKAEASRERGKFFSHVVSTLIARQSTKIRRGLSGLCADNPFSAFFFLIFHSPPLY